MVQGLLYVESEPGEVELAEYQDWYDNEHVPLRMDNNLPEFITGARYEAIDGKKPGFTAVYELTTSEFMQDSRYTVLRANRSTREANLVSNLETLDRRAYNLIGITGPQKQQQSAKFLLTVDIDTKLTKEELTKWYEEEHLEMLSKLPGWQRTSRYELVDSLATGKGKKNAVNAAPKYFTVYEFSEEGKDVLSSPVLKDANETPRAKEILASCSLVERMWKLHAAYKNTAHK